MGQGYGFSSTINKVRKREMMIINSLDLSEWEVIYETHTCPFHNVYSLNAESIWCTCSFSYSFVKKKSFDKIADEVIVKDVKGSEE